MAGLLPDIDTLKDGASDLAGALGIKLDGAPLDPIYVHAAQNGVFPSGSAGPGGASTPWEITGTDWYKVFAYQFAVVVAGQPAPSPPAASGLFDKIVAFATGKEASTDSSNEFLYTLPIPPQTMGTRMVAASQATPTVGGVVEETSANVFWLINMSGTTGIAVTRGDTGVVGGRNKVARQFRDKITTTGLLSGPLAGVNSVLSKVGGVADQVMGAVQSGSLSGLAGGLVGAVNTALLPPLPYAGSGVDKTTNGFTEMQELHRFLYTYSKLKASNPNKYSLKFRNFKTDQEWDCIIQDFQVQQNAQNPMQQRYVISIKGWNVTPIGSDKRKGAEYDRFGPNGDLKAVSTIDPTQMFKLFVGITKKDASVDFLLGT